METYTALEQTARKKSYTKPAFAIGIFAAVYGLAKMDWPLILMGACVLYVLLYKKTVVVDEEGIKTTYNAVFFKKNSFTPFTEIQAVLAEGGNDPEMTIGFIKNGMASNSLFTRSDGENVVRLAKEGNPNIVVRTTRPRRKGLFS
ncbi:MAG: hypothetical protein PHE41_05715 [Eubacteriales bacterium]|nr:hypothetical protein [Eubacteriales bacterium]